MTQRLDTVLRSISLALLITGLGATAYAQTFAYVAETGTQDIAVVDTSANTITTRIPVQRPSALTLSPDGTRLYLNSIAQPFPGFNIFEPLVVAIDTATNTVAGSLQLNNIGGIAVSPDNIKLYAAEPSSVGGSDDVLVVDAATLTVTATIPMPTDRGPHSGGLVPVISPDGSRLYVGNRGFGDIYIVDTATNTIIDTIPELPSARPDQIDIGLYAMAISPDGSRLYASNHGGGQGVSVIDTATKAQIGNIPQPGMAELTVTPDGSKIWACGVFDGGPFYVLDTTTFGVTTLSDASAAWFQAGIAPDGSVAYVVDGLNEVLVGWDTTTLLPVSSVALSNRAFAKYIAVGNVPPAIPFAAFDVAKLEINSQGFSSNGSFTIGTTHTAAKASAPAFDPATQNVTLTAGSYTLMIPAGSFRKDGTNLHWKFIGNAGAARVNADIKQQGKSTTQFDYSFDVNGPNLTATAHPIRFSLKVGLNVGTTNVP